MKNISILVFTLFFGLVGQAQVTFQFTKESAINASLKVSMEQRITKLLTEINAAEKENRALQLDASYFSERALGSLNMLWENIPFTCEDDVNIQRCLNDQVGFQVREIPVTLKPKDDSYKGSIYKELTISFGADAEITGVRLSLDTQSMSRIMETGGVVTDARRRREILKFVEDFRSYYNERNLKALEQIYSDDALIITGKVVMQKENADIGSSDERIIYSKQSKSEYIQKLSRIFKTNKYIDVGFSEISVVSHPSIDGFYGVTLRQAWNTSNYSDDGYLFLLWDFRDEEKPMIHVRTWQPTMVGGKEIDKDDIFTLADFEI